ncbi:MAG: TVP38/TMEM64 family protein, partial [Rhodospirillales bacterium]|nr:TVP38/TMEM64 family protein [Rhodospirillales bacterium]
MIVITIVAILAMVRVLPVDRLVDMVATWVQGLGILGILIFALIYVVAAVLMLPGAALTLAAGAIFGLVWGTVAVSIGATLGAAAAFLIARYLAREKVARKLENYPKFKAVDRAVSEGGWKIVALLRLSPAVPFNLQNYLYGLTAIRFWTCVLTSWAAMLPGTFMYVYLGYIGRAGVAAASGEAQGRT